MIDINHIILENYWRFFKGNILQKQRKIRQIPLQEVRKIQWKRLKNLLDYVYINNDFYKDYFESVDLTPEDIKEPQDMRKLPLTEKKTFKQNFNKIISKGVNENNLIISCTSGSTGEPFKFYIDILRESPNLSAAFILNKEMVGIKSFEKSNEFDVRINPRNVIIDLTKKYKIEKGNFLQNLFTPKIIGIRSIDIKPQNIDNIIQIIEDNKIEILYGYSSSILFLSHYIAKHSNKFKIKYAILIGEGLLEHQKSIISTNLHCPVYMDYSASECMRMGFECKYQNGYHMDIYNYFFEYINDKNDYAKNDEIGDIVVTNLNNYIFPFIRYRIGDAVLVSDQLCQCGIKLPIVKKIFGRAMDIIKTPIGKSISIDVFYYEFELLYEYVNLFRVIQIENDELLIKIVPTDIMNEEKRISIENLIRNLTENSMKVTVELMQEIPPLKSGKKRVVISKEEYERLIKNGEIL